MAMLSTGKVLVWSTGDNARVWNPTNGTFTLTPFTFGDLHCAGQSTLADGRVVVVGGQNVVHPRRHERHGPVRSGHRDVDQRQDDDRPALVRDEHDARRRQGAGDVRRRARTGRGRTIPEVYDPATNTWVRLTGAQRDAGPLSVHVRPAQRPRVRRRVRRPPGPRCSIRPAAGSWTPGPIRAVLDERLLRIGRPVPAGQDPAGRWRRSVDQARDGRRHERREPGLARDRLDGLRPAPDEPDAPGRRHGHGHRRHRLRRQRSGRRPRRGDLGPDDREVDDGRVDDRGADVPLVGGPAGRWPGRRRRRRGRRPPPRPDLLAAVPVPGLATRRSPRRRRRRPTATTHRHHEPGRRDDHVGRPAATTGLDACLRHEPALRAAGLHPVGQHAQRDRTGERRLRAARRLHAHHQGLRRACRRSRSSSGSAPPGASSPARSPAASGTRSRTPRSRASRSPRPQGPIRPTARVGIRSAAFRPASCS